MKDMASGLKMHTRERQLPPAVMDISGQMESYLTSLGFGFLERGLPLPIPHEVAIIVR